MGGSVTLVPEVFLSQVSVVSPVHSFAANSQGPRSENAFDFILFLTPSGADQK